jgi:hypothetical protein
MNVFQKKKRRRNAPGFKMSQGKRMEDGRGEMPSRVEQEEDVFDPMAFYKQQQQAMLLQASQQVEETRQDIKLCA